MDLKKRIAGWHEYVVAAHRGDKKRSTVSEWVIHKPTGICTTIQTAHIQKVFHASIPTNGTNTQIQSIGDIMENAMTETSEQYQVQTSPTTTYSLVDFHARLSAWQENGGDL